jgi:hypothetical protein
MYCQTIAAGLAGKVGIFRKLRVQLRFGRRDLAGRERNAIGKTHNALGYRAQVVRHVWAEDDRPERPAPFCLVIPLPIVLEYERAALADEKRMQALHLATLLRLSETLRDPLRYRSR